MKLRWVNNYYGTEKVAIQKSAGINSELSSEQRHISLQVAKGNEFLFSKTSFTSLTYRINLPIIDYSYR